jgi:hypothetical protein
MSRLTEEALGLGEELSTLTIGPQEGDVIRTFLFVKGEDMIVFALGADSVGEVSFAMINGESNHVTRRTGGQVVSSDTFETSVIREGFLCMGTVRDSGSITKGTSC